MANIVGLVTAQMKSVCDGLGAGIKSLLMDSETISTISIACPQSALMRQAPQLDTPASVSYYCTRLSLGLYLNDVYTGGGYPNAYVVREVAWI